MVRKWVQDYLLMILLQYFFPYIYVVWESEILAFGNVGFRFFCFMFGYINNFIFYLFFLNFDMYGLLRVFVSS